MIPLNVTHTAIATEAVRTRLLGTKPAEPVPGSVFPPAATPLRHTVSTIIGFFAETYKATFGFLDGPPLHDALTIAYVSRPDLFTLQRFRVDVELSGTHTAGETVVDMWNYRDCDADSWGPTGKNCMVAEAVNVCASLLSDGHPSLTKRCSGQRVLRSPTGLYFALRRNLSPKFWNRRLAASPSHICSRYTSQRVVTQMDIDAL